MTSRERVLKAFGKLDGTPDRPPLQFDLCRSLTDHFGEQLGIEPDYALSYYEDLTYRISANDIRTVLGSDCVVVGGTVPDGYAPTSVRDDITLNDLNIIGEFITVVTVVRSKIESVRSISSVSAFSVKSVVSS